MVNTARFRSLLLAWFRRSGRTFPWRQERDPYRVWVSEIMLQQTTTETVLRYYDRFLLRFPTCASLASAELSEVLSLWEGLGYYRRARQLHQAAKILNDHFGGNFPTARSEIEKLPGIGRYTAGAILSFAFDRREPILEANTARLYARLTATAGNLSSAPVQNRLWSFAEEILPKKNCGDFNQALIDLGSVLCLPNVPHCESCPIWTCCQARRLGRVGEFPTPKITTAKERRGEIAFLIPQSLFLKQPSAKRRYLFVRYPENLRWGGLWDFPRFFDSDSTGSESEREMTETLRSFLGDSGVTIGATLGRLNHVVTRYQIQLRFCEVKRPDGPPQRFDRFRGRASESVRFAGGETELNALEFRWLTTEQARKIPLNVTGRKLVGQISIP